MADELSIAERVKDLRERARLSTREMADALKMPHMSYRYYETDFKQPYLPLDVAEKIAAVLAPQGIPPEQVMILAGSTGHSAPMSEATGRALIGAINQLREEIAHQRGPPAKRPRRGAG